MKRGLIYYIAGTAFFLTLLTPASVYSGGWFNMTGSSGTENAEETKNPKSKLAKKIFEVAGENAERGGRYIKENPDKVIDAGKNYVDSLAPGVGTITEKVGREGIKLIQQGQEKGYNPPTGVVRKFDYNRRRK